MSSLKTKKMHSMHAILVSLILIISMFVSGCSGLFKPSGGIADANIHTGTQGIEMSFLGNAPPAQLIAPPEGERTEFQVGVKIDNKGAYDIKDGNLLLNVEKDYMEIKDWQIGEEKMIQIGASGEKTSFELKGRSQIDLIGEGVVAIANVEALPLESQSITHTSGITMTACYDYETLASADVCIDTDINSMKSIEKTCTAQDISLSGGQGAPVSVDKIEVKMLPESQDFVRPQFVIHISNQADGMVLRRDKIRDACSSTPLNPEDINVISVYDVSFSGYSLMAGHIKCSPDKVKLRGSDSRIVCTVEKGVIKTDMETYRTQLQVTLKYGYSQSISADVEIARP